MGVLNVPSTATEKGNDARAGQTGLSEKGVTGGGVTWQRGMPHVLNTSCCGLGCHHLHGRLNHSMTC